MRRFACLGLGLAALTAGCLSNRATASSDGTGAPPGAFTLSRAGAPPVALSTAACVSGERQQFLGADFSDEAAGYTVRLVVDPLSGPAARVFSNAHPFDDSAVFQRSDCRVFHFAVDSTGWRIDHYEDYKVSLELDCAGDGVSLAGKAAAEHCH